MSEPATLQFWYDFASPYSHIAAQIIEGKTAGLTVDWRPFLLGPIFKAQGWADSPFNLFPAKGAYMMRDVARLCADLALPWRRPTTFPRHSVLAARIALQLPPHEIGRFSRAVFHANFAEDQDIAQEAVLMGLLRQLGLPLALLDEASTPEHKNRLRRATEEAQARSVFGAPFFLVGDEPFWGTDRLDQAVAWARAQG